MRTLIALVGIPFFAVWPASLVFCLAASAAEPDGAQQAEEKGGRIFVNVFVRKDERFENMLISVDPASGRWQKIGGGDGVSSVRVSPDRQTLLFAQHEDGIWTTGREGGERKRVLFSGSQPVWSPDGKQIISHDGKYEEGKGWKHSNWRANVDGSDLTRLLIPDTEGVEDWSPDGNWVATVSDRHPPQGSGYQIYVMRPDGSDERRITKGGLNVYSRFSPDSSRLLFTRQDKSGNSLWVARIDGSESREIIPGEGPTGAGAVGAACWSPDGKQLAVHRYDWEIDEKGRKIKQAGNDHDDHLEIWDVGGEKKGRRLTLSDLQPLHMGHPEWR